MKRVKSLLLGFAAFVPLAAISVSGFISAVVELTQPWGIRSAPPRNEVPPSLLERSPDIAFSLAVGVIAFCFAAHAASWGVSQPNIDENADDSGASKVETNDL